MWIGSYKLRKNVYPPNHVVVYIHKHVTDLYLRIEQELAGGYTVVLDKSRQSESSYLSIFKDGKEVRISFRNHVGSESSYQYAVFLWKYKTWDECEGYFIKRMLPRILNEVEK